MTDVGSYDVIFAGLIVAALEDDYANIALRQFLGPIG